MKIITITALFLIAANTLHAQCTAGNCTSGSGTYNYGWCVYTGEFKNGKPEGKGTMKYDDHTYTGHFTNGLEDGEGIEVNIKGSQENVKYASGKKIVSQLIRVPENEYKPIDAQDKNCISGNCVTGFGTYQFSSGNKYVGNFSNYKREGAGIFYFANGDKFDGTWHADEKASGTYNFSTGAKYVGNYDANGLEYNGLIISVAGMGIRYVNGKAIIPPPPKIQTTGYDVRNGENRPKAANERVKMTCSVCFGSGKQSRVEDWSGPTVTKLVRVYQSCWKCHGSGVE